MSTEKIVVPIKRWEKDQDLPLPAYQSSGAVAVDLHAAVIEDLIMLPGNIVSVPCGFAIAIPVGYEAQVRPRSGLAGQFGISVINSPGTIDSDYRGEVKVLLINLGSQPFIVKRGMRIAQMLVLPVPHIYWKEVSELPPTPRSDGGFGHTGK
jgi:dUTP pyrophosphatase